MEEDSQDVSDDKIKEIGRKALEQFRRVTVDWRSKFLLAEFPLFQQNWTSSRT